MIKIYLIKISNIFRFIFYSAINFRIHLSSHKITSQTLLLIRLDSIGDYLLVRNFIRHFKQAKKYNGYKITLCGNKVWKDLAETFDSDVIDDFIWIDRKKFNNNLIYKYRRLKQIYSKGFEVVIDTTFSREILYGDSIVRTSKAKEKIGSTGSTDSYVKWKRNLISDRFYNRLIPQSADNLFEFYRNREFFEQVFQEPINILKPQIFVDNVQLDLPTKNNYVVVFPGAQEEKRRWSKEKFAFIIQTILREFNFDIVIAGSHNEKNIADKLVHGLNAHRVFNLTGKTTLPQLAKLISLSKALVSNETSAVHFAASLGTPFVCISNGQRFGRFMPYPDEMKVNGRYIYPSQIENKIDNFKMLNKRYQFDSDLDINTISPDYVIKALSHIL